MHVYSNLNIDIEMNKIVLQKKNIYFAQIPSRCVASHGSFKDFTSGATDKLDVSRRQLYWNLSIYAENNFHFSILQISFLILQYLIPIHSRKLELQHFSFLIPHALHTERILGAGLNYL